MKTCKCSVVTRPSDQDPFLHTQNKNEVVTQGDLEITLLLTALTASNIAQAAFYPDVKLKAASHCQDPTSNYLNNHCFDLSKDQWRKEAARWFKASPARIQFNLLEIMGSEDKSRMNYDGIPQT